MWPSTEKLAVGYFSITETILSRTGGVPSVKTLAPNANLIPLDNSVINTLSSAEGPSGHPSFDTGPANSGHLSSLSTTPSPSVSGHGQPCLPMDLPH